MPGSFRFDFQNASSIRSPGRFRFIGQRRGTKADALGRVVASRELVGLTPLLEKVARGFGAKAPMRFWARLVCGVALVWHSDEVGLMLEIKHKKTKEVLLQVDAETFAGRKMLGSRLRGANLAGVDLSGADLVNSDLREADLQNANLAGASLNGACLNGANLVHADLSGADLTDAHLHKAELQEARMVRTNLRYAQLPEAILCNADLSGADLSMADVRADLHDANLSKADLRAADLTGANLRGADLQEANLTGAKLNAAQFGGARTRGMIDVAGNRVSENPVRKPRPNQARTPKDAKSARPTAAGQKVPAPWWKFWARA